MLSRSSADALLQAVEFLCHCLCTVAFRTEQLCIDLRRLLKTADRRLMIPQLLIGPMHILEGNTVFLVFTEEPQRIVGGFPIQIQRLLPILLTVKIPGQTVQHSGIVNPFPFRHSKVL